MDKECCKIEMTLRGLDVNLIPKDIQCAFFITNLLQLAKTCSDNLVEQAFKKHLIFIAKSMFECNLKGKVISGKKTKYTWKKIEGNEL